MTYDDFETSTEDGSPVELYEFTCSTGQIYRYTSDISQHVYSSNVYYPISIERDDLTISSNDEIDPLNITMVNTTDYANEQVKNISASKISLKIYRFHRDDPDEEVITFFDGQVVSNSLAKNTVQIEASSILSKALTQNIPNHLFSTFCNHTLGSPRCGVNLVTYTTNTVSNTVNGTSISVLSVSAFPDQFYKKGVLTNTANNDKRMILSQIGTNIIIDRPMKGLVNGSNVSLTPGCDHTTSDCGDFSNLINFGGMPFMPTKNPFTNGLK